MQKDRIVLISGKQGSGKSTLSRNLCEVLRGSNFKFAGCIYEIHNMCLPILQAYGVRPKTMEKDGELLQVLGTEYGRRRVSEDVWVKATQWRVNEFLKNFPNHWAIIDDARFENEFDAFPNAWRVRLEASREARKLRVDYWREQDDHPSEVGLDAYAASGKFDFTVKTEGDNAADTAQWVARKVKGWGSLSWTRSR